MSEEENERDFIKVCFNVVAGLEVKNENQAIAKEAILDEVEYLTKENQQLKEVIEEVREKLKLERKVALSLKHPYTVSNIDEVLQILDKAKGEIDDDYNNIGII